MIIMHRLAACPDFSLIRSRKEHNFCLKYTLKSYSSVKKFSRFICDSFNAITGHDKAELIIIGISNKVFMWFSFLGLIRRRLWKFITCLSLDLNSFFGPEHGFDSERANFLHDVGFGYRQLVRTRPEQKLFWFWKLFLNIWYLYCVLFTHNSFYMPVEGDPRPYPELDYRKVSF